MEYRSSTGGQSISGDISAAVGSSHGVQLSGGSTGGRIQAIGDDASIALRILAKGAGPVLIGDSSQAVTIGGSTSAFKGFFSSTNTWSANALSSGQVVELTFANTAFDVNPGDGIFAIEVTPTTNAVIYGGYRLSTANASRLTVVMANVTSTVTSTFSGGIRVTWADLT